MYAMASLPGRQNVPDHEWRVRAESGPGAVMPAMAVEHWSVEVESGAAIAASFHGGPGGATLCVNRVIVLDAEQREVCRSWARACLHEKLRFVLLSAEDLAGLSSLG